jgi:hypothetical protein
MNEFYVSVARDPELVAVYQTMVAQITVGMYGIVRYQTRWLEPSVGSYMVARTIGGIADATTNGAKIKSWWHFSGAGKFG